MASQSLQAVRQHFYISDEAPATSIERTGTDRCNVLRRSRTDAERVRLGIGATWRRAQRGYSRKN